MYRHFFGFQKYPFCNTPDTEFFFESESHIEALASLVYAINERKGFATITGEIGSGKTIVSRKLINNLNTDVEVGLIPNTCIREDNFLKVICEEFHLPTKDCAEAELLSSLNDFLLESLRNNKNIVLIIDEAQNLSIPTLEKIRMLSNLETEKEKLLQIILLGQSELKDLLNTPETEQIRQRIHVWFHLKALNENEVRHYIDYRLKIAGNKLGVIFSEEALNKIYAYSKGIPRIVNTICDNSLLIAFVRGIKTVDKSILEEVAKDLGYAVSPKQKPVLNWKQEQSQKVIEKIKSKSFYSSSPALVLASLIVVLGIFHLFDTEQTTLQVRDKLLAHANLNYQKENVFQINHTSIQRNGKEGIRQVPDFSKKATSSKLVKKKKLKFVPTESELD